MTRNPSIAATAANQVNITWEETRNGGDSDIWLKEGSPRRVDSARYGDHHGYGQPDRAFRARGFEWRGVRGADRARNAATTGTDIFLARSDVGPWTNTSVVATAGDQSEPTGWTTTGLHVAFVDVNDLEVHDPGNGYADQHPDPNEPRALPKLPEPGDGGDDRR